MSDVGRLTSILSAIVKKLIAPTAYHALYEYRVISQSGNLLDLSPADPGRGLPALSAVPMRPGVSGAKATLKDGTSVLVGFVNGDPSRPAVLSYDTAFGDGLDPDEVDLVSAHESDSSKVAFPARRVVRYGDQVSIPVVGSAAVGIVSIDPTATRVSKVLA